MDKLFHLKQNGRYQSLKLSIRNILSHNQISMKNLL